MTEIALTFPSTHFVTGSDRSRTFTRAQSALPGTEINKRTYLMIQNFCSFRFVPSRMDRNEGQLRENDEN